MNTTTHFLATFTLHMSVLHIASEWPSPCWAELIIGSSNQCASCGRGCAYFSHIIVTAVLAACQAQPKMLQFVFSCRSWLYLIHKRSYFQKPSENMLPPHHHITVNFLHFQLRNKLCGTDHSWSCKLNMSIESFFVVVEISIFCFTY